MAQTYPVEVRVAWWVAPYLFAATLFIRSIAPFLDGIDDDRVQGFINKQAAFVATRGVHIYIGGRRV